MSFRTSMFMADSEFSPPQWFIDKWQAELMFSGHCICSRAERKRTMWLEVARDIQRSQAEGSAKYEPSTTMVLVHECGDISRLLIAADTMELNQASSWQVTHISQLLHLCGQVPQASWLKQALAYLSRRLKKV